jgi:hypothetical protein
MVASTRKKSGLRMGGARKVRLPGLKHVVTKSAHNKKKKVPRVPNNPVIDDGEMDFSRPPSELNIEGVKLWRRAVKTLQLVGELTSDDYFGLRSLCYTHQQMVKLMRAEQPIPTYMQRSFDRMIMDYGMTPAARMRMDPDGKLRKNGPPDSSFGKKKVFEEENLAVEGEEKERSSNVSRLENKAAALL